MPEAARRYRQTVHYLQHKTSVQQALDRLAADIETAGKAVAAGTPDVAPLERARVDLEIALREIRGMLNMDDSAIARREPAA